MRENVINDPVATNPPPTRAARRILGPWALSDTRLSEARAKYAKPRTSVTGRRGKAKARFLKTSRKMT